MGEERVFTIKILVREHQVEVRASQNEIVFNGLTECGQKLVSDVVDAMLTAGEKALVNDPGHIGKEILVDERAGTLRARADANFFDREQMIDE